MSLSSTEDRLRALLERGWRPYIKPHAAGLLSTLERDNVPGPWTITEHRGEQPFCTGWEITVSPNHSLYKRGATSRVGGVYATLDQCLDEAEAFIKREEARVAAIETRP
jgi:hypothetical protein